MLSFCTSTFLERIEVLRAWSSKAARYSQMLTLLIAESR